jgi:transposase-like protein
VEPTITSLVRMGLTHAEIAQRLGVSERHVRTLVRDAGLSADVPGRPVSRPACVDDPAWLAARTVAQAAADAGVSESTINRARARHRVSLNDTETEQESTDDRTVPER